MLLWRLWMAKKNLLLEKMKKDKAFADILRTENVKPEWLSTNCISINLLLSGKIKGGIKKGAISQICADSGWGKSMIGYAVLKSAYDSGMSCFIIDTENATNTDVLTALGIDMSQVGVYETNKIPELKQILAKLSKGLSKAEAREVFVLFDSWGPIVEQQILEKAEEGSSAVNMSSAKFKNELANVLLSCGFTTLVMNHVYESLQMYGDKFNIPGGKRLFFNSDAIVLGTSAAKFRDKDREILGKIVTAHVAKGRAAKEYVKTKYLILHEGGINPFYGLLDEALESGVVFKPKNGSYARIDFDVNKETGEVEKSWKEADLYCAKFWIPLYKSEKFIKYVESKFSFEDNILINSMTDVMRLIEEEDDDEDVVVIEKEK